MPPRDPPATVDVVRLGNDLRDRREKLGVPQDRLALAVGISRVYLQEIERGKRRKNDEPANPTLAVLAALCRELGGRLTIDVAAPGGLVVEFDPLPADPSKLRTPEISAEAVHRV